MKLTPRVVNQKFTENIPTYFFVCYIEVATQNYRFLVIKILEVIPEVLVPALSIAKPIIR